jgi:uncharacterized protein YsxB (DUF464 family)
MIHILVNDDRIIIAGHAGAAPHGQSVPCEAVTSLVNCIAASLDEITGQGENVQSMKSGEFILNMKDLSAESGLLVRSFLLGLQLVTEAYPEYITMTKL